MFGYLYVNKPELKIREYDEYHACYCGVCRELKHISGLKGQVTVSYDSTFLTLLLTGLYEPDCRKINKRCIACPFRKNMSFVNIYSEYGAMMNFFLTYYKCIDDWNDDRKLLKFIYARLISKEIKKVRTKYSSKCAVIEEQLKKLKDYEKTESRDIDAVSGCFGHVMEEIFNYSYDIWNNPLRKMGFYLGKYIYIMDAYEDVEADIKAGNYNVLKDKYKNLFNTNKSVDAVKAFETECHDILSMMLAECSMEFEKLPVIAYADILRNILYSGVWCRFKEITDKRLDKCKERK